MSKVRNLTTVSTYSLAHTAQCKLKLSAKRGDRDLRFILGHAFTLDNVMLRIMEIENQSAKSSFLEGRPPSEDGDVHYDCSAAKPVEPEEEHYDCSKAAPPPPPEPEPEEHYDCSKPVAPIPAEPDVRGRRISFQDNNARPSNTFGGNGSNNGGSPARKRSPPPVSLPSKPDYYLDDSDSDGTSSDDYDEPSSYGPGVGEAHDTGTSPSTKHRRTHDAYSDSDDAALELADDELDDDMNGLSLTRFASASAQPPRMIRSNSSSSEDDDDTGPVSPPQLPADVDVREIIDGDKDEVLERLYDDVRRCACHGLADDHDVGAKPAGIWDVPAEKSGGKRLAVVAIAA